MKERVLRFEITGDGSSIIVPFDDEPSARYQILALGDSDPGEDEIVLRANRDGFRALARLFAQLAEGEYRDEYHVHLGLTHLKPQGPGWRVILEEPVLDE